MSIKEIIRISESSLVKIILYSINNLPTDFSLGINKHMDILMGSKSSFILDQKLFEYESYGVLNHCSKQYLKNVIEKLITEDLLTIIELEEIGRDGNPMKVIGSTKKGIDFLIADELKNFEFTNDALIDLNEREWKLFGILRILRNNLAKDAGIPVYLIINNPSLLRIVISKPDNSESMLLIKGIGPSFVEKYANTFLETINIFLGSSHDENHDDDENLPPVPSVSPNNTPSDDLFEDNDVDNSLEEMESIPEIEDRLEQQKRHLEDFKEKPRIVDSIPQWKNTEGNTGTSFRRNKKINKARISTPHPSACKVCNHPTGMTYSYQCSKCKSIL